MYEPSTQTRVCTPKTRLRRSPIEATRPSHAGRLEGELLHNRCNREFPRRPKPHWDCHSEQVGGSERAVLFVPGRSSLLQELVSDLYALQHYLASKAGRWPRVSTIAQRRMGASCGRVNPTTTESTKPPARQPLTPESFPPPQPVARNASPATTASLVGSPGTLPQCCSTGQSCSTAQFQPSR
jgi:hypothetical protein